MAPNNKITWEELDRMYPQLEEIEIVPEDSPQEEPLPIPPETVKDLLWKPKPTIPKA